MKAINLRMAFTIVISILAVNLYAQYSVDSTNNYYYYTQKLDAFYDSIKETTSDTVKIPGYKDYERQKEFWNTRVYNCDTVTGDYSKYIEQLKLYSQNPSMLPTGNNSNTWEFVGPKNLTSHNQGIIVSLYIDPNNINNVLAGTNNSGMFKTTDGGQNWVNVTDNLGTPGLGVNDIAVNPSNPTEIYIATGNGFNNYGFGIFKTTDNCNNWQQVLSFNPNERILVRKLLIDSENPSIIYALANKYVYRSKNGGSSWEMIFDQLTIPNYWDKNKYLIDIEFKPNDHNTVYISSVSIKSIVNPPHEFSAEVWKTHNAKANSVTWQRIENGLPDYVDRYALETDQQNPDKLYVAYTGPGDSQYTMSFYLKEADYPNYQIQSVYEKLNYYSSYGSQLGGLGYWRLETELSPTNSNFMFIGGYNMDVLDLATNQIVKSYQVGSSSNPYFHVDQRIFKTSVANGKTYLFCGNDGGVSRYNYTDDIMESINGQGLDNLQYFGIGDCEAMPEFFIGGTQDNGEIGNGPGNWIRTNVGDSYENIIDPVEPNIVYCTNNGGGGKNVRKSNNYGLSFNPINGGIPSTVRENYGLNDRPFVMSPQDRNTLFIGYHEVYKTVNGGNNWQQLTHLHDNGYNVTNAIKAIALTSASPNIMYVGYNGATWVASGKSRLFKTNDGGATWTDLTVGVQNILHWSGITDIVVSDLNPTDVWVSFDGFSQNNGNAINKVLYSGNADSTWTDITANLPNLPVNCLQKVLIDNYCRIIIGNDLGMFLYDPQQASWINISNGLPPVPVSDIEINYAKAEMRIATFGRGIWKSKFPCSLPGSDIHIIASQVWNRDKVLSNSLYVEAGNTLEIKSSISLTSDAKIIVKPGAKLILNGATLTNACSSPWQGIQVWGDKTHSQYPDANGNYYQGYLELKNGATIENAIVAVDLWESENWSSTGGIVYADGATFRNNAKSVHALYYKNFNPYDPSQEWDYSSNFKNCTFEITENYPGNETFYKHVDLSHVRGIDFQHCSFSLAPGVAGVSTYNNAIAGYDAQFRVSALCNSQVVPCPEEDLEKCTFTGFYRAVSALNDGGSPVTFYVNNADFINNAYGVKIRSMNNATVLFSNFEIGQLYGCGAGINSDNVTGFAFEENNFSKYTGGPQANYFGIIINNSHAINEVYKNNFTGLSYANFADGKNWIDDDRYHGLAYYCNQNSNNYADFFVNEKKPSGIQSLQGSDTYPAGNTFTQNGATWHFYNGGEHLVQYFYNQNNNNEIPEYPGKVHYVAITPVNGGNSCPSHYGNDIRVVLTSTQKADAEQVYYNNLSDYNSVKTLYDNYVDGGSTSNEKLDIETAQPDDMWALRSQLLGDSPHLSFDVLKKAADKTDVFTESALFDILAANPDELRKDTLISYLENKEEPLPDYMIDLLKQLAKGTTYKTALQEQLSEYKHDYTRAALDIVRSILNDTITNDTLLRNWLDNLGDINYDRQIIASYVNEGNFTDAFSLANMLPQLYNLDSAQMVEHNYYIDLLTLYDTLYSQGRNTYQMDSTEKALVEYITANSTDVAGSYAKSILEAVDDEYYPDCPDITETAGYKQGSVINSETLGKIYGLDITVKPNPAKQWAAFDYTLPEEETTGTIAITNSNGVIVKTLQVSGHQGQKLLDTRKLPSGMYLYSIKAGRYTKTGKMVIIK